MEELKATVGVYDTHHKAINAIRSLENAGIDIKKMSIIGKAEIVEDHLHAIPANTIQNAPVVMGSVLGAILGALTGASILTVPGLGIFYGAGAVAGAFGGFDFGLIGGGLTTILLKFGIQEDKIININDHLEKGKFLVLVNGNDEEVLHAKHILNTETDHIEVQEHV